MTKRESLADMLSNGKWINRDELLKGSGFKTIRALQSAIQDLRRRGYSIESRRPTRTTTEFRLMYKEMELDLT